MDNSQQKKHIFINEEKIGNRNSITISGKIEVLVSSKNRLFCKELIYFTLIEDYNIDESFTMFLRGFDIYNIIAALEDIKTNSSTKYRKYTDSGKSKNSINSLNKYLNFNIENEVFHININSKDNNNNERKHIGVKFDLFEINGIIEVLKSFMNEYKNAFYKTQRYYEKINDKNKKALL